MEKPKQIIFTPKDNGDIQLIVIEPSQAKKKEIQLSLLDWGKLEGWKNESLERGV